MSSFRRQVAALTAGTFSSQVILTAGMVVISRLFTPTEFGLYSAAIAIATILATGMTLRYEMAIPLAEDRDEAARLAIVALLCAAIGTATCLAAIGLAGQFISPSISLYAVMSIPISALALGAWSTAKMLRSREQRFSQISTSGVAASFIQTLLQILAGVMHLGSTGLVLCFCAARWVNTCLLGRIQTRGMVAPSPAMLHATARQWRRFPLLNAGPAVLNAISVSCVAPLIASLYSAAFAGQFALAARVLAAPAGLIGQAVSTAFFPRAASTHRSGEPQAEQVRRLTCALALLAIPPFGAIALLGPELFSVAFGSNWETAGLIAAVLSPWLAANFVSSPLSTLATVHDKLEALLFLSILEAMARLAALYVGGVHSPLVGVALYSATGLLISVAYVGWILRIANISPAELILDGAMTSIAVSAIAGLAISRGLLSEGVYLSTAAVLLTALTVASLVRVRTLILSPSRPAVVKRREHS